MTFLGGIISEGINKAHCCSVFSEICTFKLAEDLTNFIKTYGIYRLLQGFRAGQECY